MFFRVAADAEAEIRVARLEQRDEVAAVAQAVLVGHELGLALGRVAAERHDVAVAAGVEPVGDAVQLLARVADAGEVGHDREADVGAQQPADLRGAFAGAAAGAVGHGHKVGGDTFQRNRGLPQRLHTCHVFGREKFQRAHHVLRGEEFGDGPVGGHSGINASAFDDV